jgi:hypothetical protein
MILFWSVKLQGCDSSVLLDGSASGPSEQDAPPNLTLRPKAFEIIDDLRERIHKECGRVVSCADIAAIAARDSVYLVTTWITLYITYKALSLTMLNIIPFISKHWKFMMSVNFYPVEWLRKKQIWFE